VGLVEYIVFWKLGASGKLGVFLKADRSRLRLEYFTIPQMHKINKQNISIHAWKARFL
jgi:hypothetical protein